MAEVPDMKFSIIVPAYNEEKLLPATLTAIREAAGAMAQAGCEWELIVCDNNSTDRTAAIAREHGGQVVFEAINQIGRARNTGAAAATGDWLLFIDADSLANPELFAAVIARCRDHGVLAGGCAMNQDLDHRLFAWLTEVWNFTSRTLGWMAGSFIFVRTEAFRTVGGFDLSQFAGEEITLSRRLKKLARERNQRIEIITEQRLLTSGRKMTLYSKREQASLILRSLFLPFFTWRRRQDWWYDGRR